MSDAASDYTGISKRLKEMRLEKEMNSALAKLTHKDSCAFYYGRGDCSCGAAAKEK